VALGATMTDVVRTVLWDASRPLLCGLAAGVVAAVFLSRFLTSLLFEIRGYDPASYAGASLFLLVVGALACLWPAWKAAVRNPVEALRE